MEFQTKVFYNMHILRHGPPLTIRCENEYNNGYFEDFFKTMDIALLPVAAKDHEANGLIENANRTLRRCFNQIRACQKRSSCEAVVTEAVFDNNLILGSCTYEPERFQVDDRIAIYRDGSGWLRAARVVEVTPHHVMVEHKGRRKSSGLNRTRLLGSTFNNDEPSRSSMAEEETHVPVYGNWAEDDGNNRTVIQDDGDDSKDGEVDDLPFSTPSTNDIPFDEPAVSYAPTESSGAPDAPSPL